jgi:serine/threonine-protein kinase
VCLWELLTLRRLFGRRSELETVQAIATEAILEPSKVRTGVPRELDAITMRALDRDVDRRTASARLLARELNQYVSTTGVTTSMSDVAELMAELFPEERARKLDVVANVLRSEDAVALDSSETSAVQRSRGVELRSSPGSIAAPRPGSRYPAARAPTPAPGTLAPARRAPTPAPGTIEPARRAPTPAPGTLEPARREPTPAPGTLSPARRDPTPPHVPVASVTPDSSPPEEATTRSTVDLADMLEPPSESSLSLRLDPETFEDHTAETRDTEAPARSVPRAWIVGAAALLAALGLGVFVIVASGVLEPTPDPIATTNAGTTSTHVAATTGAATSPSTTSPSTTSPSTTSPSTTSPSTTSPSTTSPSTTSGGTTPADTAVEAPPTAETERDTDGSPSEPDGSESEPEVSESEAPPARAGRGSINVAARGGWADLFVDGRPAGRTPRSVPLPEGRHLVELRPPGGAPIRRYVTVRAGRTQRVLFDL